MEKISIASLADGSTTDFNLYVIVRELPVLYASAPYRWKIGEIKRLLRDGHTYLCFEAADRSKVQQYERIVKLTPIDKNLPPGKRLVHLTEVAAELNKVFFEFGVSASGIEKVKDISRVMVSTLEEDKLSIVALEKLARHDYYTYFHSARVCAYALAIAMQRSQTNEKDLLSLAQGCLLHDIGKSQVHFDIINKPSALQEGEWLMMKKHPEFGDDLIKASQLSPISREIILHHHERIDGRGYPHNLSKYELLDETKIASFADVFDALTTNRSYHTSKTRFEALQFIKTKLLDGLDQDIFKSMVEILNLAQKLNSD